MSNDNKVALTPAAYAIIGVVIVNFLFWYFYLNDYLAYQSVASERTIDACDKYQERFPKGFFQEDVDTWIS